MVKKKALAKKAKTQKKSPSKRAKYPRHSVEKALRIPKAILDQRAGKVCTDQEAASFFNLGSPKGAFAVEIAENILSALKNPQEAIFKAPTTLSPG